MYITYPLLFDPEKFHVNALIFVGATLKKRYKKSPSCSILQHKNILSNDWETWNLACRFFIPVGLSMYNFMSLYWFLWQLTSKRKKKLQFCSILLYKNKLPDVREIEIWNVRSLPPLVCPCKNSCQCPDFCRSHAQKKYKKSLSCSILQYKNILPDNPETWNLARRFFIPVSLSLYNFMSL